MTAAPTLTRSAGYSDGAKQKQAPVAATAGNGPNSRHKHRRRHAFTYLTNRRFARYAGEMLLFKKKFLPAIRSGEKTQTIRLWKHRRMRAGQRSYIPGVGHVRVKAVEPVELDRLTDADARPDGFQSARQLREEIARLYPEQLAAGYRAYRVVFELEGAGGTTNVENSTHPTSSPKLSTRCP